MQRCKLSTLLLPMSIFFIFSIIGCQTIKKPVKEEKISLKKATTSKIQKQEIEEIEETIPEVYINQVGYLPLKQKYFITNVNTSNFSVISTINEEVVYSGEILLLKENDRSTGKTTYIGDFSELTSQGSYQIMLDDNTRSYSFNIGENIFNDVAKKSIKSFYFQRCGTALHSEHAGVFARDICHINDSILHPSTNMDGTKESTGGWHDAGDYGKYINPGSVSVVAMLMAYEQWPEKFNFDDNNIPESNNGVSDFLDEIKYELDWFLKMQNIDPSDPMYGAVHYMINTKTYVWSTPEGDDSKRFLYDYSSVATANFAATLAAAYRSFKDIPLYKNDADKYLAAAKLAWNNLEKNPDLYPLGGFVRPTDTETGGYAGSADGNDSDDRMWAAVELFLATEESKYHDAAMTHRNLNNPKSFSKIPDWKDTSPFALYQYMMNTVPGTDLEIQGKLKTYFLKNCDRIIKDIDDDGFKDALTRYYWGGNGGVMLLSQYLITAYELTSNQIYYDGALSQFNYLLGTNAHNLSFVTKVGTKFPERIHHAALAMDGVDDIYPGMVPGGPTGAINGDETLPVFFTRRTPDALCYVDSPNSWASNENCILYNAPLVGVAAYFSDFK